MPDNHSEKAALRGEPSYVWRSGQQRRLDKMLRWADLDGRILDNGCGLGAYLNAMAPFSDQRFGLELELDRAVDALDASQGVAQGVGEQLPFAENSFDFIFSNEVIEHVADDTHYAAEMVRVTRPGGKILIFCPNRWYPVEQHGIFWRGQYKFGNIPLINYLPDPLRHQLAPHVRTYTKHTLLQLFEPLPVILIHHERVFGGYDNIEYHWPQFGRTLKKLLYAAENTPLSILGLSHFLVLQKTA